ncbi:MAG: tRNA 2-thiocytidine biosynthesis protein TtcA [Clostridiales bacterium]|jgi:tRNA(Ile)-lysidine synthase TilS/MesJ|nr:tRNA 2-thiocytidine biosynthesis protein TtcA [Clostridiales bacterium]
MARTFTPSALIERGIQTKFRKTIWNPFITGVKHYNLVNEGDKIAVCMSGGKDSALLAKLMQELQKHGEKRFELAFIVMDPGYSEAVRRKILSNVELLGVPATLFNSKIYGIVKNMDGSPCYMCARMRRGHLYKYAMDMGCGKIALGHHFSDVIETTLMGMLYGAQIQTMMPKLHSRNFPGMELIRPLYRVREDDIISWRDYNNLEFINCACPLIENCQVESGEGGSKRAEVKRLIRSLKKTHANVENCIFKSVHMVNLETIIGYKRDGKKRCFLDDYDDKR